MKNIFTACMLYSSWNITGNRSIGQLKSFLIPVLPIIFFLQVYLLLFSSPLLFSFPFSSSIHYYAGRLSRSFFCFTLTIHIGSSSGSNSQWTLVEMASCKIINRIFNT